MDKKILKCPFCGSKWHEPKMMRYYNRYTGCMFFVECLECGATSKHQPTEEYAIDSWNKRVE